MSNQKSGLFISGLLLGSVIGTATGLLIAPRTGKKTRQLVKKSASAIPQLTTDLSTSLKFQTDRFSDSTTNSWEEILERVKQAIAAGLEASQKERKILSQIETKNSEASVNSSREEGIENREK
ncbi:MAG: YtxH domain-containing protein [Trichodesmium sp. St15_bin1_1]|jgi:gas vesicle protein|nr:YtxH domain-containing protein [Trichodesmium sp. MAG_R02]MDE5084359.1 YtxH domain-containing protein [Trichodesmium sp. St18_bin1]MDE5114929.1 YtxH domain-containing protein [Trichodesmium sp. St15_bin1_1]MDE5119893.1 YtxH domain-containing protein [Trichodesmium sp. St19_bin1]